MKSIIFCKKLKKSCVTDRPAPSPPGCSTSRMGKRAGKALRRRPQRPERRRAGRLRRPEALRPHRPASRIPAALACIRRPDLRRPPRLPPPGSRRPGAADGRRRCALIAPPPGSRRPWHASDGRPCGALIGSRLPDPGRQARCINFLKKSKKIQKNPLQGLYPYDSI